jgi:hypothetical protein
MQKVDQSNKEMDYFEKRKQKKEYFSKKEFKELQEYRNDVEIEIEHIQHIQMLFNNLLNGILIDRISDKVVINELLKEMKKKNE